MDVLQLLLPRFEHRTVRVEFELEQIERLSLSFLFEVVLVPHRHDVIQFIEGTSDHFFGLLPGGNEDFIFVLPFGLCFKISFFFLKKFHLFEVFISITLDMVNPVLQPLKVILIPHGADGCNEIFLLIFRIPPHQILSLIFLIVLAEFSQGVSTIGQVIIFPFHSQFKLLPALLIDVQSVSDLTDFVLAELQFCHLLHLLDLGNAGNLQHVFGGKEGGFGSWG